MDFVGKVISNLANAAGVSATEGMKFVVTSCIASTQVRATVITNYLRTPNAKLFSHLVFLQTLIIFGTKRESILLLTGSKLNTGRDDDSKVDSNHQNIAIPSKVASWLGRASRCGICWASACCSILFTTSIAFDVLFRYKIETVGNHGDNRPKLSETMKDGVRFVENFFNSL